MACLFFPSGSQAKKPPLKLKSELGEGVASQHTSSYAHKTGRTMRRISSLHHCFAMVATMRSSSLCSLLPIFRLRKITFRPSCPNFMVGFANLKFEQTEPCIHSKTRILLRKIPRLEGILPKEQRPAGINGKSNNRNQKQLKRPAKHNIYLKWIHKENTVPAVVSGGPLSYFYYEAPS